MRISRSALSIRPHALRPRRCSCDARRRERIENRPGGACGPRKTFGPKNIKDLKWRTALVDFKSVSGAAANLTQIGSQPGVSRHFHSIFGRSRLHLNGRFGLAVRRLRCRPSDSRQWFRRGLGNATTRFVSGIARGAIAGRPSHDHGMNSPSSGRIQLTIRL
jgi:hypothetical protein